MRLQVPVTRTEVVYISTHPKGGVCRSITEHTRRVMCVCCISSCVSAYDVRQTSFRQTEPFAAIAAEVSSRTKSVCSSVLQCPPYPTMKHGSGAMVD